MVSKKMVTLVREFAQHKGYDVAITELAIMSLFKEIKQQQTDMKYEFLKVQGLGTFFVKPWAIARNITLRKRWLNKNKGDKEFNENLVKKLEKIYAIHHKRYLTDVKNGMTKDGKIFIDYYRMFEDTSDSKSETDEIEREYTKSMGEQEADS